MPEPVRIKALLAKVESTYGTDATPSAGSDEIQVVDNLWTNITVDHLQDNLLESFGPGFGRPGGQSVQSTGQFANFTVTVPLKGAGSAYGSSTTPESDVLLRASGLNQNVDDSAGSEKVNYTPQESGFESASIYLYAGNKEFQLVGCFATCRLMFNPGEIPQAEFDVTGLVSAINEASKPGSLSYSSSGVAPPTVTSAGFTVDGFDPDDFQSIEVDFGTEIAERPGGNASDGHAGYWISNILPTVSADYEVADLSSHDPYGLRNDGTEFSWDLGTLGGTQYNQIDVSGPAGRFTSVGHSENNGLAQFQTEFQARNSGLTSQDSVDLEFS